MVKLLSAIMEELNISGASGASRRWSNNFLPVSSSTHGAPVLTASTRRPQEPHQDLPVIGMASRSLSSPAANARPMGLSANWWPGRSVDQVQPAGGTQHADEIFIPPE